MPADTIVTDVTDATFEAEVIEASKSRPVVVDFWAPWCGPCKVLGPIIEKVAAEHAGKVALAKLNTDENPRTAMSFRIQGIPAVKAFSGGRVIAEFVGAQPEPNVRQFFKSLAGAGEDGMVRAGIEALQRGDTDVAEQAFRRALDAKSDNVDAIAGLAEILIARGDEEEAERFLGRVPASRKAKNVRHRVFLRNFAEKHGDEDLEGEAAASPDDPRARYRWGVFLASRQDYQHALDELLESVRLDRSFADGAARKAVLAVFDLLGPESPLVREYQRKLSMLLF